jgi:hypothetical protein
MCVLTIIINEYGTVRVYYVVPCNRRAARIFSPRFSFRLLATYRYSRVPGTYLFSLAYNASTYLVCIDCRYGYGTVVVPGYQKNLRKVPAGRLLEQLAYWYRTYQMY